MGPDVVVGRVCVDTAIAARAGADGAGAGVGGVEGEVDGVGVGVDGVGVGGAGDVWYWTRFQECCESCPLLGPTGAEKHTRFSPPHIYSATRGTLVCRRFGVPSVHHSSAMLTPLHFFFSFFFFFAHFYFPASGQAVVAGVVPSPPRFLPSIFIAHRVQHSHCSSIFYRMLLTHALALSASQFVRKKKSPRIYTSMHSAGLELTKRTYTRLEDSLIRHRGDRHHVHP